MSAGDTELMDTMKNVGIRISHIMDYFVQQNGSYQKVGFIPKDLYNQVDKHRREQLIDGDAEVALTYPCGISETDPAFVYEYDTDDEGRLCKLFWTDGRS